jgi:hypothetical protein
MFHPQSEPTRNALESHASKRKKKALIKRPTLLKRNEVTGDQAFRRSPRRKLYACAAVYICVCVRARAHYRDG